MAYFETETKALGLRLNRKPQQGNPLSRHGAIVAEEDFCDNFFVVVGGRDCVNFYGFILYSKSMTQFSFCDYSILRRERLGQY